VALVLARIAWTGKLVYAFLVWNLFLAWLPLIFARLATERFKTKPAFDARMGALLLSWLVFFPNAPYIFTDLTHLTQRFYGHFWVDLSLLLIVALTGLVLGFLSLFLMHALVARRYGRVWSWLFVMGVAGLSSVGVYLGRFLRFNTWDILLRPGRIYQGIENWASNPLANPAISIAFPALFATFIFLAYLMLYSLTHLPPTMQTADVSAQVGN